jgi:hypothetical protein
MKKSLLLLISIFIFLPPQCVWWWKQQRRHTAGSNAAPCERDTTCCHSWRCLPGIHFYRGQRWDSTLHVE